MRISCFSGFAVGLIDFLVAGESAVSKFNLQLSSLDVCFCPPWCRAALDLEQEADGFDRVVMNNLQWVALWHRSTTGWLLECGCQILAFRCLLFALQIEPFSTNPHRHSPFSITNLLSNTHLRFWQPPRPLGIWFFGARGCINHFTDFISSFSFMSPGNIAQLPLQSLQWYILSFVKIYFNC